MLKFKNILHIDAETRIPQIWLKDFNLSVKTKERLTQEQLTEAVKQVVSHIEKNEQKCLEWDGEQLFASILSEMHPDWEIEIANNWYVRVDQFDNDINCMTLWRE